MGPDDNQVVGTPGLKGVPLISAFEFQNKADKIQRNENIHKPQTFLDYCHPVTVGGHYLCSQKDAIEVMP
jgi:hypothetical protein